VECGVKKEGKKGKKNRVKRVKIKEKWNTIK